MTYLIAIDAGFTTTRIAAIGNAILLSCEKISTPFRCDGGVAENDHDGLQRRWVEFIVSLIVDVVRRYPQCCSVGISFAGIVSEHGCIYRENSIWGAASNDISREYLGRRVHMPVYVVNDVAAACYRYAYDERFILDEKIVLVNVGSGVGAKTYLRALDRVLLDSKGRSGEIGLVIVDFSNEGLSSVSGRFKGALNNYVSGTGFARLLNGFSEQHSKVYAASELKERLRALSVLLSDRSSTALTEINRTAIECLLNGDDFVNMALDFSLQRMAVAMHHVILMESPGRVVLSGGFVSSVGDLYRQRLIEILVPLIGFLYSREEIVEMIQLGIADDLDGILGVAQVCRRALA